MGFKEDFFWGVSTAAYQIEGGAYEDGKGLSVWDMFCKKPGAVWSAHNGDVAIDHYHRYKEDVKLMKDFGIQAYRFSLSWPRIFPDGRGRVNEKGCAFYDDLINRLLDAGITPHIMLYHWNYPLELFRRGGWMNPDSSDWFAEYAKFAVERFSDRVKHWYTLEEEPCFIGLGMYTGVHAPGLQLPLGEVLQAGHHALIGHGKAVQAMRAAAKQDLSIGLVPAGESYTPAADTPEDIETARDLTFNIYDKETIFHHSWWLDPVYLGSYPESGLKVYGKDAPDIKSGDMELINQPIDVCCVNYYSARKVRAGKDGKAEKLERDPGYPMTTQAEWAIVPEGLYYTTKFFYQRYKLPIVITENGHQNNDYVMLDGKVHDQERIDYTRRHLLQLEKSINDGTEILGYLHWTIIDNFEWAHGYKVRVGLVHCDYTTQKRTPKDSVYWYKKVIETNGAHLHEDDY